MAQRMNEIINKSRNFDLLALTIEQH